MRQILICMLAATMAMPIGVTHAAVPSEEQVTTLLTQIKSAHRVLWPDGGEARIKSNLAVDPDLNFVWELIHTQANHMLTDPPVKRELIGRRLLDKSRTALQRTMFLGMAYRLTGDHRYSDRAIKEMLDVAGFEDWHPAHFLDVAEMTAAMGIGLDWCRDAMSEPDIATVRQAIIEKGLKPSLAKDNLWIDGDNNWNQVCHGGATLGALAISDTDPDLAAKIIVSATEGLPYIMKNYAPDGAYPEGPGYWDYGTTYNAMTLSALQNALGTDFGLSSQPGFLKTGSYMLHVVGPTGLWFNYSDCSRQFRPAPAPAKFYFSDATGDDSLVYPDRHWITELRTGAIKKVDGGDSLRFLPLLLLWAGSTHNQPPASLHYVGDGITPVATFRSGWDDQATFAAIKAGSASTNHAHMDAGTFVIDALGERWVDSLGMQNYDTLEKAGVDLWNNKQNSQRWQVFRLGPMSQNVLTVDDKLQQVAGHSTIVKSGNDRAVIDLGPVYEDQIAAARRGIWLEPTGSVTLRDEVTAGDLPVDVRFAFLTRAKVQLNPDGATLSLHGKAVKLTVSGISGLQMQMYSTVGPQPYDAANPGTQMLGFKVPLSAGQSAFWNVEFVPEGKSPAAPLGALDGW